MAFQVVDPSTGTLLRELPETPAADVERILVQANREFADWRRIGFEERAAILRGAAEILRDRAEEWADLMAEEMGKPLHEGRSEAEKCAWACEHYAEHAERFLAPEEVETDASRSYVSFQPLGVILSIMPWNFPFWQAFRFAAPALMAGNAIVLKHAANVPGCAAAIEEVLHAAGLPPALFRSIRVGHEAIEKMIQRPEIRAVTLTGSTRAGRAVAAQAGAALKKSVLELGGSDPYIILADADMEIAVEASVTSRLINSGQSCIAAKRFIVVRERREEFEERFLARLREVKSGDPREAGVQVGPLARQDLRETLHRQVRESVTAGARVLTGGEIPDGAGWFYPPTLLSDVGPGMPAYEEELFGPVAALIPARDEEHAIELANDSVFGLGGAVFTADVARGERLAREDLDVGCAFVNDLVRSDPRVPFGGVKESGYGRELGILGIREFVNAKTVWVA